MIILMGFIFLIVSNQAEAQGQFLVRYKTDQPQMAEKLSAQQLRNYLRSTTANQEALLIKKLKLAPENVKTLWILEGSILKLSRLQVLSLKNQAQVKSVIPLGKVIRLSQSSRELDLLDDRQNFTYGLIQINLPAVQGRFWGLDGRGVRIGIIDTGISDKHPDLTNRVIRFKDFVQKRTAPYDDHGHGTHVAGTAAGKNSSGRQIGVASGAELIIAKSFNSRGNTIDADLLLSLQWMTDPDENPNTDDGAHFINNSWNTEEKTSERTPDSDPFCEIIPRLKALGSLPVFAAGNDGPRENTITPPAACPDSLSIGATDQDDRITDFSSRGPVRWKNLVLNKPELSAPGKGVLSADRDRGYRTRSGTSMAAPHVTGGLALLKQAYPDLDPYELEELIKQATFDLGNPGYDHHFGFGRLDLLKGLSLTK